MDARTLKAILALPPDFVAGLVRRKTTRAVNTSKSTPVGARTEGRTWTVTAYGEAWGVISSTYRGPADHCLLSSYTVHPSAEGLGDFKVYASNGGTPRRALTRARNIIRLIVQTMRGDNTPEIQAALPITCPLVAEASPEPVPAPAAPDMSALTAMTYTAAELEEDPAAPVAPEPEPEEAPEAAPEPDWSPSSEEAHDAIHGIRHPTPETLPGLEPSTVTCTPRDAEALREYAAVVRGLPVSQEAMLESANERQPDYPIPEVDPQSAVFTPGAVHRLMEEDRLRGSRAQAMMEREILEAELSTSPPPMLLEAGQVLAPMAEPEPAIEEVAGALVEIALALSVGDPIEPNKAAIIEAVEGLKAALLTAAHRRAGLTAPSKPHLKSGRAPYGFKRTGTGFVHCEEEREAAEEIARGRVNGESWGEITVRLSASRMPGARSGGWTRGKVRSAFRARLAWLDEAKPTRP